MSKERDTQRDISLIFHELLSILPFFNIFSFFNTGDERFRVHSTIYSLFYAEWNNKMMRILFRIMQKKSSLFRKRRNFWDIPSPCSFLFIKQTKNNDQKTKENSCLVYLFCNSRGRESFYFQQCCQIYREKKNYEIERTNENFKLKEVYEHGQPK